jgi:hypothetical protein
MSVMRNSVLQAKAAELVRPAWSVGELYVTIMLLPVGLNTALINVGAG